MSILSSKYFICSIGLYGIIQLMRLNEVLPGGLINSYGADLVCMPVVLSLSLFFVRKVKKDNQIILTIPMILFMVALWSVYFELYLPSRSPMYTSDPVDAIVYFVGGASFYVWQKKTQSLTLKTN